MTTATAAPAGPATTTNGSAGAQTTATTAPVKTDAATGPQTSAVGQPRGPDGKFQPKDTEKSAQRPQDDDPEIDLGDIKLRRSQLKSELGRARSASKLLTEAQKAKAEALRIQQELEQKKQRYRENIEEFFRDQGMTDEEAARAASEYLYRKHIAPSQMTPEQLELQRLREQLKEKQTKEQQEAEERRQAELRQQQEQAAAEIRRDIASLIEQGAMPKSPMAVRLVAAKMHAAEAKGLSIDVATAWQSVQDEFRSDTAKYLENASIEDLQRDMPPEAFRALVKRVTQWALSRVKQSPGLPGVRVAAPAPRAQPTKIMSPAEFEELRRQQLSGHK